MYMNGAIPAFLTSFQDFSVFHIRCLAMPLLIDAYRHIRQRSKGVCMIPSWLLLQHFHRLPKVNLSFLTPLLIMARYGELGQHDIGWSGDQSQVPSCSPATLSGEKSQLLCSHHACGVDQQDYQLYVKYHKRHLYHGCIVAHTAMWCNVEVLYLFAFAEGLALPPQGVRIVSILFIAE